MISQKYEKLNVLQVKSKEATPEQSSTFVSCVEALNIIVLKLSTKWRYKTIKYMTQSFLEILKWHSRINKLYEYIFLKGAAIFASTIGVMRGIANIWWH